MSETTTVGLDLAKSVVLVHGGNIEGCVVVRRQLRHSQVRTFFERLVSCLIGMEASSRAHHWAREMSARGRDVRLMVSGDRGPCGAAKAPWAGYGKPYVERGKTDAADAEAIFDAVARPAMRFVPVKSAERQAALLDHVAPKLRLRRNARDFLVRQRTQTVNAIRAHLAEFGVVVPKARVPRDGKGYAQPNLGRLIEATQGVPKAARPALEVLAGQFHDIDEGIEAATIRITAAQQADPMARRLVAVPGLGPIASRAFAALTPNVAAFRSGRDDAASC